MDIGFTKGVAFVFEGATEKAFYYSLIDQQCRRRPGAVFEHVVQARTSEVYDVVSTPVARTLVKARDCGGLGNVPKSAGWFYNECRSRYPALPWTVFLCYDTEDYQADITQFTQGDWKLLHKDIAKKASAVYDIAAAADIEDILLIDLAGICAYYQCPIPAKLNGRKGKVKLQNLCRDCGRYYHSGERAYDLIASLDMDKIISSRCLPLETVIQTLFESSC